MTHRLLTTALAALCLPALAACGDAQDGRGDTAAAAAAPATPVSAPAPVRLDGHELALQLGNGFRAALDRLAVLQQPREGATDLGQDLPTGLLRDVRCSAASGGYRCRVRWETLRGTPQRTDYAVRVLKGGCFAAGATPRMRPQYDPTIATYTEHPLNAVASLRKGC
ncbi:MAG TPA: hypothetical protein VK501_09835 [Baekduia sp.]|uniref:hypothetical protein n=1 Tax=Baekduia sp. TaxID=2600305 RepID=UPI002BEFE9F2|nr:hypothetical protein [Baekduia sp.]HMJ34207.1 hypothetical protein [Baekduia sp.]